MEKVRQKLAGLMALWPQILIACAALALAFVLGMSIQSEREASEKESNFYGACIQLVRRLPLLSNDLENPYTQAMESPMENPYVENSMRTLRMSAAEIWNTIPPRSADYPNATHDLSILVLELLGNNYADIPSASQILAICVPLQNASAVSSSPEELMAALEQELNTVQGQEALKLMGTSIDSPSTVQGEA